MKHADASPSWMTTLSSSQKYWTPATSCRRSTFARYVLVAVSALFQNHTPQSESNPLWQTKPSRPPHSCKLVTLLPMATAPPPWAVATCSWSVNYSWAWCIHSVCAQRCTHRCVHSIHIGVHRACTQVYTHLHTDHAHRGMYTEVCTQSMHVHILGTGKWLPPTLLLNMISGCAIIRMRGHFRYDEMLHKALVFSGFCFCFQLCQPGTLPSRAVGYAWKLVYSTERNGFSLKTMYRTLSSVDTPVLLVIRDTQAEVSFTEDLAGPSGRWGGSC